MEDKLREIVAEYVQMPKESLTNATPVDKRSLKNSIILHRMYARLAKEGMHVKQYAGIKTFGELSGLLMGTPSSAGLQESKTQTAFQERSKSNTEILSGVGIDIEKISNMPKVDDFRTEEFYLMNFHPTEIAYCILQKDPYASFAGLFAAKEAIVKAANQHHGYPFNSILIGRTELGKPVFEHCQISISHADDITVAVAIFAPAETPKEIQNQPAVASKASTGISWPIVISLLALLLSVFALVKSFKGDL